MVKETQDFLDGSRTKHKEQNFNTEQGRDFKVVNLIIKEQEEQKLRFITKIDSYDLNERNNIKYNQKFFNEFSSYFNHDNYQFFLTKFFQFILSNDCVALLDSWIKYKNNQIYSFKNLNIESDLKIDFIKDLLQKDLNTFKTLFTKFKAAGIKFQYFTSDNKNILELVAAKKLEITEDKLDFFRDDLIAVTIERQETKTGNKILHLAVNAGNTEFIDYFTKSLRPEESYNQIISTNTQGADIMDLAILNSNVGMIKYLSNKFPQLNGLAGLRGTLGLDPTFFVEFFSQEVDFKDNNIILSKLANSLKHVMSSIKHASIEDKPKMISFFEKTLEGGIEDIKKQYDSHTQASKVHLESGRNPFRGEHLISLERFTVSKDMEVIKDAINKLKVIKNPKLEYESLELPRADILTDVKVISIDETVKILGDEFMILLPELYL